MNISPETHTLVAKLCGARVRELEYKAPESKWFLDEAFRQLDLAITKDMKELGITNVAEYYARMGGEG